MAYPQDYIRGVRLSVTGNQAIASTSGRARDRDNTTDLNPGAIALANAWQVFDPATGGGFDGTGASDSASTWYQAHLVFNPGTNTYALLVSASKTAPTMPAGFTKRRWVGPIRNDSAANLLQGEQVDEEVTRMWLYRVEEQTTPPFRVLTAGAAVVPTLVSCAEVVPPQARTVMMLATSQATVTAWLAHAADSPPTSIHVFMDGNLAVQAGSIELYLTASQEITYRQSGGGGFLILNVLGYRIALDGGD